MEDTCTKMWSWVLTRFSKRGWTEDERRQGREQGRQEHWGRNSLMDMRLKLSHAANHAAFLSVKIQVWSSSENYIFHPFEPSPTEEEYSLQLWLPLKAFRTENWRCPAPHPLSLSTSISLIISVSRKSIFLGCTNSICKILIQREYGTLLNVSSWPEHQVKYWKLW